MDASDGKLEAAVRGEVESDEGVLILRRIFVSYRLETDESNRQTVERVHAMHHRHCPVYRSITPAIEVETELEIVGP